MRWFQRLRALFMYRRWMSKAKSDLSEMRVVYAQNEARLQELQELLEEAKSHETTNI